jgi:hypothetical protein
MDAPLSSLRQLHASLAAPPRHYVHDPGYAAPSADVARGYEDDYGGQHADNDAYEALMSAGLGPGSRAGGEDVADFYGKGVGTEASGKPRVARGALPGLLEPGRSWAAHNSIVQRRACAAAARIVDGGLSAAAVARAAHGSPTCAPCCAQACGAPRPADARGSDGAAAVSPPPAPVPDAAAPTRSSSLRLAVRPSQRKLSDLREPTPKIGLTSDKPPPRRGRRQYVPFPTVHEDGAPPRGPPPGGYNYAVPRPPEPSMTERGALIASLRRELAQTETQMVTLLQRQVELNARLAELGA